MIIPSKTSKLRRKETDGRHVKDTAAVPRRGAAREGCDVREEMTIPSLILGIKE